LVDTGLAVAYIRVVNRDQEVEMTEFEEKIEGIATAITSWDCQDVTVLRDLLSELKLACVEATDAASTEPELAGRDYNPVQIVNLATLPSAPLPAGVDRDYPSWAADVDGNLLVGDAADHVISLADWLEVN
jgi:hypothetical protein